MRTHCLRTHCLPCTQPQSCAGARAILIQLTYWRLFDRSVHNAIVSLGVCSNFQNGPARDSHLPGNITIFAKGAEEKSGMSSYNSFRGF